MRDDQKNTQSTILEKDSIMDTYERIEDIPISFCECCGVWPDVIADIYRRAVWDLGGDSSPLLWGPAHVVWEDCNFDSAEDCLHDFEENVTWGKQWNDFSDEQLRIVRRSLEELARIPENIRERNVT